MMARRHRQRGVTLLVGLIMLLLMTILSITVFQLGKGDLIIVSNAQQRSQSVAVAQAVIEEAISRAAFLQTPAAALNAPCDGVANTRCIDVDGNTVHDFNVTLRPSCLAVRVIPSTQLDYSNANDASCLVSANQDTGVAGIGTNASLCANMLWDFEAVAADQIRQSEYVINQGTAVRVEAYQTCP